MQCDSLELPRYGGIDRTLLLMCEDGCTPADINHYEDKLIQNKPAFMKFKASLNTKTSRMVTQMHDTCTWM